MLCDSVSFPKSLTCCCPLSTLSLAPHPVGNVMVALLNLVSAVRIDIGAFSNGHSEIATLEFPRNIVVAKESAEKCCDIDTRACFNRLSYSAVCCQQSNLRLKIICCKSTAFAISETFSVWEKIWRAQNPRKNSAE